jgi:hypothetical protein
MKLAPAAAILAVFAAAACGDATRVTLRYRPAAGASFRYVMNQDVTVRVAGSPEERMAIYVAFTQTTKGPVDSGTEVSVRVDSVSLTAPRIPPEQASAASQMLRGLESAIVLDERMHVVRSAVSNAAGVPPQMANQIVSGLRGASFPLPATPVGRGDSWQAEMAAPMSQVPGLTEPIMLRYRIRVQKIEIAGADTIVHFDVRTSFPEDPIQVQGAAMRFGGALHGAQQYSLARSAIVRVELDGTVRVTTAAGGADDEAVELDQRLVLHLVTGAGPP